MRRFVLGATAAAFAACALATAQTPTPFKLGTFERQGRTFVGIVLRDTVVIDLAAANAAIRTPASTVAAPADMKDLIARYDAGVRTRIGQIVSAVEGGLGRSETGVRPRSQGSQDAAAGHVSDDDAECGGELSRA